MVLCLKSHLKVIFIYLNKLSLSVCGVIASMNIMNKVCSSQILIKGSTHLSPSSAGLSSDPRINARSSLIPHLLQLSVNFIPSNIIPGANFFCLCAGYLCNCYQALSWPEHQLCRTPVLSLIAANFLHLLFPRVFAG